MLTSLVLLLVGLGMGVVLSLGVFYWVIKPWFKKVFGDLMDLLRLLLPFLPKK